MKTHWVKADETWESIAAAECVELKDLLDANGAEMPAGGMPDRLRTSTASEETGRDIGRGLGLPDPRPGMAIAAGGTCTIDTKDVPRKPPIIAHVSHLSGGSAPVPSGTEVRLTTQSGTLVSKGTTSSTGIVVLEVPHSFDETLVLEYGAGATVARSAPFQYQLDAGLTSPSSSGPGIVQAFRTAMMTGEEFTALTGVDPASLSPGATVGPDDLGFSLVGAGAALVLPNTPEFPLPNNVTGLLWTGAHASDIAVVDGSITARGFRSSVLRHLWSDGERALKKGGGAATASLNRGVTGFWANDWLFPYFSDATVVYPAQPITGEQAAEFAAFLRSKGPDYAGKTYRYSPPDPTYPAWKRAYPNAPIGFEAPPAQNCITLPLETHQRAIGGGVPIEPAMPGPEFGAAKSMTKWVKTLDDPSVVVKRIGPAMQLRVAAGTLKLGGTMLLIYRAKESLDRIDSAAPPEKLVVIGEEAGGWTAGWVGSALSETLGGAFVCAETGPGAFFCVLGFGLVGGIAATPVGQEVGHQLGEVGKALEEPNKLVNTWIEMFGTDQQKKAARDLSEVEGLISGHPPEDNPY